MERGLQALHVWDWWRLQVRTLQGSQRGEDASGYGSRVALRRPDVWLPLGTGVDSDHSDKELPGPDLQVRSLAPSTYECRHHPSLFDMVAQLQFVIEDILWCKICTKYHYYHIKVIMTIIMKSVIQSLMILVEKMIRIEFLKNPVNLWPLVQWYGNIQGPSRPKARPGSRQGSAPSHTSILCPTGKQLGQSWRTNAQSGWIPTAVRAFRCAARGVDLTSQFHESANQSKSDPKLVRRIHLRILLHHTGSMLAGLKYFHKTSSVAMSRSRYIWLYLIHHSYTSINRVW